jgi:hypothetical protein
MFAPRVLCNWREERPFNQGDLDSRVTVEVGSLLHGGGPASGVIFASQYLIVVVAAGDVRTIGLKL